MQRKYMKNLLHFSLVWSILRKHSENGKQLLRLLCVSEKLRNARTFKNKDHHFSLRWIETATVLQYHDCFCHFKQKRLDLERWNLHPVWCYGVAAKNLFASTWACELGNSCRSQVGSKLLQSVASVLPRVTASKVTYTHCSRVFNAFHNVVFDLFHCTWVSFQAQHSLEDDGSPVASIWLARHLQVSWTLDARLAELTDRLCAQWIIGIVAADHSQQHWHPDAWFKLIPTARSILQHP